MEVNKPVNAVDLPPPYAVAQPGESLNTKPPIYLGANFGEFGKEAFLGPKEGSQMATNVLLLLLFLLLLLLLLLPVVVVFGPKALSLQHRSSSNLTYT